jgi:adhesin transport system outer membrane protein
MTKPLQKRLAALARRAGRLRGTEQWSSTTTRARAGKQNDHDFYSRGEASLVLQQTIWDGLATYSRYQIGVTRLDSATSRLLDNSEAAVLDGLLAHLEVYRQRRLAALSELNVQNHRDILASQEERQRLGASSVADVTQTRGRLARAQASLVETRSALEIAMAQYKRLTGKDAGELEAPTCRIALIPVLKRCFPTVRQKTPK